MPLTPDDSPWNWVQFTPHPHQNIDFVHRQLLYIFNASTILCVLLFGVAESRTFGLNEFDQIAYPPLLICLLVSLVRKCPRVYPGLIARIVVDGTSASNRS
ncbi:MAG: hypothetical protein O3A14_19175, partial [Cyanobacteria bacterium]|nr:hypothetical protein [Cyanobacteriota bacterium]